MNHLISMTPLVSPELLWVCEHLLAEWADWLWEGTPWHPSNWIWRVQLLFQVIWLCPVLLPICVHHANHRWSDVSHHRSVALRSRTRFKPATVLWPQTSFWFTFLQPLLGLFPAWDWAVSVSLKSKCYASTPVLGVLISSIICLVLPHCPSLRSSLLSPLCIKPDQPCTPAF